MSDMKLSGGVAIEFDDSDFEAGGFVKVAAVVRRIAEFLLSKGAPNMFQAERDAWPHVLTGVTLGALHPVDPSKMQVLSVDHCTDGMIRFDELVAWGQANKLFEFERSTAEADEQKTGAGGTISRDNPREYRRRLLILSDAGMSSQQIAKDETTAGRKISASRVRQLLVEARSDLKMTKKEKAEAAANSATLVGQLGIVGSKAPLAGKKQRT